MNEPREFRVKAILWKLPDNNFDYKQEQIN